MRKPQVLVIVGGLVALCGGCVPAVSTLAGGGTTPEGRTDILAGGAAAVIPRPLGGERAQGLPPASGGVAPVVGLRRGLDRSTDGALLLNGATAVAMIRTGWELQAEDALYRSQLLVAAVPFGGLAGEDEARAQGWRGGVRLPLQWGIEVGVLEAWAGTHVEGQYYGGETAASAEEARGYGFGTGGSVGLATGFRRIHAIVALDATHRWWRGEVAGARFRQSGWAFTPSFGLRLRL